MNKLNFILIIAFLSFSINYIFAQKNQLRAKWETEEYKNIEELSNMDFLYDSDEGLLYLLTNDEENLYVHLRTINEIPEKKLIYFGFSVEIKIKGDKKKRVIEYPLPLNERKEPVILIQNNSEKRRNDFSLIKEQMLNQIYKIRLNGFNDDENLIIKASENKFNIIGDIKINKKGQLQYLLVIPLKTLDLSLADDVSMNIVFKSGSKEIPLEIRPSSNVNDLNIGNQNDVNRPAVGAQNRGQGPQQGNMAQQQLGAADFRVREEIEESIIIRIKNIMLAKKAF